MLRLLLSLLNLSCFALRVWASSSSGNGVLVVLDPLLQKDDYSIFFGSLEKRGYSLTFRAPKDVGPAISDDDIPQFAHVILFTPETKQYAKDLSPQNLINFLAGKSNLIVALSEKQTPLISLAAEFSLIPPPPNTPLISHFPERQEPAGLIPIPVPKKHLFLSPNTPPVWFSGIPFATIPNSQLVPILNAPEESFATDTTDDGSADVTVEASEKGGEGLWAGSKLSVVSGFQVAGGARVVWAGGVDVFSDKLAQKEVAPGQPSGNAQFVEDVSAWAFQETNVLRLEAVSHHRVNESTTPETYTTNDKVVFTAKISKWDKVKGEWAPCACRKDIQLEFTMLDPHIRTSLPPVAGMPGFYSTTFRAPDRHGVFKFVINYKRNGWTHILSSTTVPVVPPRHDGYPRFISAAWPYYVGAISTSVAFVLFSALFLGQDVRESKQKTE